MKLCRNSNGAQISAPANPIFQNIVGGLFGIGDAGSPGIDILKPYPISKIGRASCRERVLRLV